MPIVPRLVVRATDESHRVTTLELFFDLVFVFALTQVTQLMADDPTTRGLLRGLVLLALLWFGWSSYAWLGNQAQADEGLLRLAMVVAMGAMFVVALAIPEAFDDLPGGLFAPFVLAACYATVRGAHLVVYLVAAGDDRGLRHRLLMTAIPTSVACCLLVAGGAAGPPWQSVLWALALVVDYGGVWLSGTEGWRVNSAAHFAERHGLIVIVALGESIVAIGVGVADQAVTGPVVLAAMLGLGVSIAMWWVYFDVVALVAERVLARLEGEPRARLARDSYTYLHFPMLVGIVYLALGMKKVLTYVADPGHHPLSESLPWVPVVALYGGAVLYLVALSALRRRNVGGWNRQRLVVSAALLALLPVAAALPALAALALLAAVLVGLIGYEASYLGAARDAVRHSGH
ncbi:MAG TPA: low temperature requirement protein A [Actinomycetes bacterium]